MSGWGEWWEETRERLRAMAIVAGMTLPAFGVRPYQTRELKDVYGATDVPPEEPGRADASERRRG